VRKFLIIPILFLIYLLVVGNSAAFAQQSASENDSTFIKVHFLYGSKPLPQYKETERKWFGGILGGHVGIEGDSGQVLNFRSKGNFHLLSNHKNKHSRYVEHTIDGFYRYFGGNPDSMKRVIVTVPVTTRQKAMFDSIGAAYLANSPYDYALLGMRCGAAAYEILGQLGIMKNYSYRRTYMKIFYPQKLRKRLLDLAGQNHWQVEYHEGSITRKWERN
jgi:hypothetical protein